MTMPSWESLAMGWGDIIMSISTESQVDGNDSPQVQGAFTLFPSIIDVESTTCEP